MLSLYEKGDCVEPERNRKTVEKRARKQGEREGEREIILIYIYIERDREGNIKVERDIRTNKIGH